MGGKKAKWTLQKTGDRLGIKRARVSQILKIAAALKNYPQLKKCRSEIAAGNELKRIMESVQEKHPGFESEDQLKDFLKHNWEKTALGKDWNLKGVEYDARPIGWIDALARHKKDKRWLVVELKVSQSSDQTVGQLLRYMGWVQLNIAPDKDETVEGLIIADHIDNETYCALQFTKNIISAKEYRKANDGLYLEDYNWRDLISKSLSAKNLEIVKKKMKVEAGYEVAKIEDASDLRPKAVNVEM